MKQLTWRGQAARVAQVARAAGAVALLLSLVACAALNQLAVEVSTFGAWPAQRQPGTYAIDRLPSQQAQADAAGSAEPLIESAARAALERAGFRPAAAGTEPDLLVQVGARVSRLARSPWDDPLWWPGGFAHAHARDWGPPWGRFGSALWRYEPARYEREVALLLRDRASGRPLYEARASSDGLSASLGALLPALFDAALSGFPAAGTNPRQVTVPINR